MLQHESKAQRRQSIEAYVGSLEQAYLLLDAIQMNRGERLSPQCVAYLAKRVTDLWDTEPEPEALAGLMAGLLDATPATALSPPLFEETLQHFCRDTNPASTLCPSLTLLIAVSYLERLKEKYSKIRGADGCASRLVTAAYAVASKYMRANLRLVVIGNGGGSNNEPPPTPKSPTTLSDANKDKQRALRMESELLHLLNYNLTISEPSHLVWWSKTFEVIPQKYSMGS